MAPGGVHHAVMAASAASSTHVGEMVGAFRLGGDVRSWQLKCAKSEPQDAFLFTLQNPHGDGSLLSKGGVSAGVYPPPPAPPRSSGGVAAADLPVVLSELRGLAAEG
jgi:hypothetical protein